MTTHGELHDLFNDLIDKQTQLIKELQDKSRQVIANEVYASNLLKAIEGFKVLTTLKKDFPLP